MKSDIFEKEINKLVIEITNSDSSEMLSRDTKENVKKYWFDKLSAIIDNTIEEEIQARIQFKMIELLTGVENQALNCWNASMSGNHPKYSYYAQAFNQLKQMLMKEMIMELPCDNMSELKKRESRDKAISKIMKRFCKQGEKEYEHKERFLVEVIHNLQNDK